MANNIQRDFLTNLAKEAGQLALTYYQKVEASYKDSTSIVTVADKEVELFLKKKILDKYPNSNFLGEETGLDHKLKEDEFLWVIDPIDGTSSFFAGIPFWNISIGVIFQQEIISGCVYLPVSNEIFYASKGQGSLYNDELFIIKTPKLDLYNTFLAVPADHYKQYHMDLDPKVSTPPCATAICYTAKGNYYGSLTKQVHLWDYAASKIIIEEAGGKLEFLNLGKIDISKHMTAEKIPDHLISGSQEAVDKMRELISIKTVG